MIRLSRAAAVTLAALVLVPAAALAHADLVETSPADGAELTAPPTEVVMTFDGELQADGSRFVVTGPDGSEAGAGELDLDVAARDSLRGDVDASESGEYRVTWTSVALDGHEEEGAFTFTVLGKEDSGGAGPSDTALPAPEGPHPLVLIGAGLLVVAAWLLGRQVVRRNRHR